MSIFTYIKILFITYAVISAISNIYNIFPKDETLLGLIIYGSILNTWCNVLDDILKKET